MSDRDDKDLLSIGSFAMLTGLSIPTLRYYSEVDLLTPAMIDEKTNYRYYRRSQVGEARMIVALRAIDLPLEEVGLVLKATDFESVRGQLVGHRDRLRARSDQVTEMLASVEAMIEKGVDMPEASGCRIAELIIGVTDLKEGHRFYQDAFDVHFAEDRHGDGDVHYHSSFGKWPGEGFFIFTLYEVEPDHLQRSTFGLLVDDLEAVFRRALSAGASEISSPADVSGMPRIARIADPSGNTINLYQDEF